MPELGLGGLSRPGRERGGDPVNLWNLSRVKVFLGELLAEGVTEALPASRSTARSISVSIGFKCKIIL